VPRGLARSMRATVVLGAVAVAASTTASGRTAKAYAIGAAPGWSTAPLLSVGDLLPETGEPTRRFRLVGVPDGIGAERTGRHVTVYLNHELDQSARSQPIVGGPVHRGAFVSKLTLEPRTGRPVSGEVAYGRVYVGDRFVGATAVAGNQTRAFARLCSGSLATRRHGFTRSIYFAGEEASGVATFSGRGGQAVAIYGDEAHVIPRLGRLRFENVVPQRRSDGRTVLVALEDGPSGAPYSHVYLYVGRKQPHGSVFARNGLANGRLYVLKASGRATEGELPLGSVGASWVSIRGVESKSDQALAAAARAAGALGFSRVEDGAFDATRARRFYFVTTGGNASFNRLGRIYQLDLGADPTGPAILRVAVDADAAIAAGGDTAVSPDNVATSSGSLLVQEDGTDWSRPVMAAHGRDGSIWRFPLDRQGIVAAPLRVAELDPPGRDGAAVPPGVWETSGIVDTSALFGRGTWLFDVQTGGPTQPPGVAGQVADGQLLLLRAAT
jgi:hypothetical protein